MQFKHLSLTVRLFFSLIIFFSFLPLSFAQDSRPIVRLIYFLPRDRHPQLDIDEKMDRLIKDAQQFFANQMQAHGFGRKTFQIETDATGNAVVHRIVGQFTNRHYNNLPDTWDVWDEIDEQFDASKNIYFTAIDISSEILDGGEVCGRGGARGAIGGKALIPASGPCFNIELAAHELGHAFGLRHDFRGGPYIMSYESYRDQLSKCTAEWLDVHRAFNSSLLDYKNNPTEIKMLPPSFTFLPNAIGLRFKVIDPDGIHQTQLMTPTLTGLARGSPELLSCQALNGSKNTIVEFITTDLTPNNKSVSLHVIDRQGVFVQSETFPLDTTISLNSTVVLPDANLRLKIMEALGKPSNARITVRDMLTLTTLNANNADINEIEGLQFAYNLTTLTLNNNNVMDADLLASLTQLTTLSVDNNDITDVVVISFLKQLKTLSLENNKISDIMPVMELAELKTLYLKGNLLDYPSLYRSIPAMQKRGVEVAFETRTPTKLINLSSASTRGLAGSTSIVMISVQDENGLGFSGVPVTFTVTTRGGYLSIAEAVTDPNGTARVDLRLGPTPGENNVRTSGPEVPQPLIFTITAIDGNTFVHIPDENLHAKIANILGRSHNSLLTADDMSKLTKLEALNANIQNLTGIEYAYNLKELDLSAEYIDGVGYVNSNTISDFSSLEALNQLTDLNLSGSSLSDVSFLSSLTQLTTLVLWNNAISDISVLSDLTQLRALYLSYNDISDISVLSGLTQLGVLNLSSNDISDTSALSGLTQLRVLYLQRNDISDVSPLAPLNLTGTYVSPDGWGGFQTEGLQITDNPLSYTSINTHIPAMQAKGIEVVFDDTAHPALLKVSGNSQEGLAGKTLGSPLVLKVEDERGQPMPDVPITFAIDTGEGVLAPAETTSGPDGKARTNLTLGWAPGTTTIRATTTDIRSYVRFTATTTMVPNRIAADVNGDGSVDVEDLVLVAASFGVVPIPDVLPDTDVNNDGEVNDEDVASVLAALEAETAAPAAVWTAERLQWWIAEAKRRSRGDNTFRRGIVVLEQLLARLLPKETALLPNYPNPFNPETWIPYQLAEAADVTLRIYAVDGTLVQTLELGHQSAGTYQNKNHTAYWDGRNEFGESVASGVYFYTLTAGEFTATRKMVIKK